MSNNLTNYPKKNTINFIVDESEKYNKISLVCFGIFLVFLIFFTKFGVINTLDKVNQLENNYYVYSNQIDAYKAKMSDYDEVEAYYNNLVGDYLTSDEQLSSAREEIVSTIENVFGGFENIANYSIDGANVVVLTEPISLKDVSSLLNDLQNNPNISFATCKSTIYDSSDSNLVKAEYEIIYDTIGGSK